MNIETLALIILDSSSGAEAIKQIYAYRKALDTKFSYGYLARKISFKSRGTLSQMIQGKRPVPVRIRRPLLDIMLAEETLIEYVELLLEIDEGLSEQQRIQKESRLKSLEFYLRDRFSNIQLKHGISLLASDILCAFDLFQGHPTEKQLIKLFGKHRFQEVQKGLRILLLNGLIERHDGYFHKTEVTKRFMTLSDYQHDSLLTYLKESIQDACQNATHWVSKQELACFGSTAMSVRKEDYLEFLKKLKKDVFHYFSDMESENGDMLVRFNMQVYPICKFEKDQMESSTHSDGRHSLTGQSLPQSEE